MAIEAKANKTGNETMGGSQASCDVPEPPTHLDGLALDIVDEGSANGCGAWTRNRTELG